VFGVIGFGPLDENETTKGVCESLSSSLLNIVAVEFLRIGKHIPNKPVISEEEKKNYK